MTDLLDSPEFCEILGITKGTAYYWRQKGYGPKAIKIGKNLRYRRADVVAWLDDQFANA